MKRRTRRGFTLTEVIVAIAISVIATAIILPVFSQTGGLFQIATSKDFADMAGTEIHQRISGDIRYTKAIAVSRFQSPSMNASYDNVFTVENGRLLLNGEQVFDDTFYMSCELSVTVTRISEYAMQLKVTLTNANGEKAYENIAAVALPNVKISGAGIAGDYGGAIINPAIYFNNAEVG